MTTGGHYRSKPASFHQCAWCGERKPIAEMRHPSASRGPTPSTCHACREGHPSEGWCDHHERPHPRDAFPVVDRPIGILNICRDGVSYRAAAKRAKPDRTCASCAKTLESWHFRGGRHKSQTCRDCTDSHPGDIWCIDCEAWLPTSEFYRTGQGGRFWTVRCKPCRIAHNHGVTRAHLLELSGCDQPQCGACGAVDDLKIDHDHRHCPSHQGCRKCVRGWLCHPCNSAEGLLKNAERARQLADYMERWSVGS